MMRKAYPHTQIKAYRIILEHDKGLVAIKTTASDKYTAEQKVLHAEGAPRSAIKLTEEL
jgi:hypothetical protein